MIVELRRGDRIINNVENKNSQRRPYKPRDNRIEKPIQVVFNTDRFNSVGDAYKRKEEKVNIPKKNYTNNDDLSKMSYSEYKEQYKREQQKKEFNPKSKFLTPNEVKEVKEVLIEQPKVEEVKTFEPKEPTRYVEQVNTKPKPEVIYFTPETKETITTKIPEALQNILDEVSKIEDKVDVIEDNIESMIEKVEEDVITQFEEALLGTEEIVESKYSEFVEMYDDSNFEKKSKKNKPNIYDNY